MKNPITSRIIKKNIFLIICIGLLFVISAVSDIAIAFMLGGMMEAALELSMNIFLKNLLILLAALLARLIFNILGMNLNARFLKIAMTEYKDALASGVLARDFKSFGTHGISYYLNVLTDEAKEVRVNYFSQLMYIIQFAIKIILSVTAIIYISWKYTLAIFFMFAVAAVLPSMFGKKLGEKTVTLTNKNEQFIVGIKGLLEGFELIRTYGLQKRISKQFSDQNEVVETARCSYMRTNNFKDSMAEFVASVAQAGAITIGVLFILSGDMTVPMLITGMQISGNLMSPVSVLSQCIAVIIGSRPLRKKHLELLTQSSDNNAYGKKVGDINNVYINNLTFAYADKTIIDDVTYCFEQGKKYAILGESGAGKSTLLRLLLGYFDNYSGSIVYTDTDLRSIDYDDLYRHIAVMHQNVFLFEDTIENNIKLFREISEEKYRGALEASNLSGVVERLTKEKSLIKDNGINLSGGEKQRIAIARSIINSPGVLFVDEATAALDIDNARMFYRIISEFKGTTCIAITHERDREILSCFDEILLLKDGKLKSVTVDEAAV